MLLKGAPLTYDQKAALGARGGAAFQGSWNNQLIAVKVLEDNVEPSAVHQRTEIWKTLVHPNILEIFGASDHEENDPEHLQVVVTALYPAGNIRQYLASYPNVERPNIILQISAGLQFLHSRNIIHGSLKPSQILVRDDGSIVIGDYGMVELQPSKSKDGHRYWSPEAWKGGVTRPSDVFAFAMTAYELVTSSQPWGVLSEKVIYQMVAYEDTRPDRPDPQLELRVGLTEGMWGIIEEAWHKDPRLRPTFDMIVRLWTAELNGGKSFYLSRYSSSRAHQEPTFRAFQLLALQLQQAQVDRLVPVELPAKPVPCIQLAVVPLHMMQSFTRHCLKVSLSYIKPMLHTKLSFQHLSLILPVERINRQISMLQISDLI
ncbi:kinase-like domain-containing protein [Mycena floridula]|nr:kinase-like domain-containing protein [Mycena floridula]